MKGSMPVISKAGVCKVRESWPPDDPFKLLNNHFHIKHMLSSPFSYHSMEILASHKPQNMAFHLQDLWWQVIAHYNTFHSMTQDGLNKLCEVKATKVERSYIICSIKHVWFRQNQLTRNGKCCKSALFPKKPRIGKQALWWIIQLSSKMQGHSDLASGSWDPIKRRSLDHGTQVPPGDPEQSVHNKTWPSE